MGLALPGGVLGDVGQPDLIRRRGDELVQDDTVLVDNREEVAMDRRAGFAGLAAAAVMRGEDPRNRAEPPNAVLARDDPMLVGELIGQEPITERGSSTCSSSNASMTWAPSQSRCGTGFFSHW